MTRKPAAARTGARAAIRRHLIVGMLLVVMLAGGVGGWAVATEVSGAVIAPGQLVVETNVKKVQHPTGGVVGELRVRDGSEVRAGDVLVRLDDTITRANLAIVTKNLDELSARQARLEAERDGADAIAFPQELLERREVAEVGKVLAGETRLFELRRSARAGQKAQLKERVEQLREEIDGRTGQIQAKGREIVLIGQELEGVRELWRKNLIQIQRVTALERDAVRIEGERAQLIAANAQTKGKISETELQILQIDQDLRSEVGRELADIRGKLSELVERKVAAEDQLKRVDIRAPQDGFVHQLAVHTVGGVVTPGEALMMVVPRADSLTVEARLAPPDIDQVRVGQRAVLRFSAFNQRTTPELNGEVQVVAADVSQDPKTGVYYYTVRIALPPQELERLGGLKLVPGMPLETFIQTGSRTVISYLMKPLTDQVARAWRER